MFSDNSNDRLGFAGRVPRRSFETMARDEAADTTLHWSWTAILTDPVRLAILRGLCELRSATVAELGQRCHSSGPTVRRHLEALEAFGVIREEPGQCDGFTPGRPARRFHLDAEAAARACDLFAALSQPLVPDPAPATQPPAAR